jgi:hypothetical protein
MLLGACLEEDSWIQDHSSSLFCFPVIEVTGFSLSHILANICGLPTGLKATEPTDHGLEPPKL